MADDELESKIAKLPTWAREHIAGLQRERDAAMRQHESFAEGEPGSPFFIKIRDPSRASAMPIDRPTKALCVGCRVGNVLVELRPASGGDPRYGVSVQFDYQSEDGKEAGRCAIAPEVSNVIRIIETPR